MKEAYLLDGILVVEDEVLVALDIQEQLLELGFRNVYLAYELSAGRELLHSKAIGLAILDVNLGRDLVFPLAEEIRAKQIPIVFSTALPLYDFPTEWLAHPVLSKPIDRTALLSAVTSYRFR